MTLAPEHELVAKITTQNRKQLLKLTLKELQNVPKRRMADVKTISGCLGAYAEHPFTKEPVPVWIGIMSWQDTEQELLWQFLVRRKRLCFC
jgi:leucyl-tRNA synthetase